MSKIIFSLISYLKIFNLNFHRILLGLLLFNYATGYTQNKYSNDILANKKSEIRSVNKPNIIFIMLDDLGFGDLGIFWQNQINGDKRMLTPMIDNMANEGAVLTQHYTGAPVCAPARASLLEGLTQGHSSIRDNQFDKVSANRLTIASLLSKAGYHTMHIGKAGISGKRSSLSSELKSSTDLEGHPLKRGFDDFYGYLFHNQGHIHYPLNGSTNKKAYFTDGYTPILVGTDLTYTTDVFTAKSKQWIVNHNRDQPERPFFLYLAYDVPHNAYQVPTQAYPNGRGINGGLQWTGKDSSTPWVNTASGIADSYIHPDYASKSWSEVEKKFATMIRRVDNAVEDIIQLLKDLYIDDNTIIVFSSDNGPTSAGHDATFFQSYANLNGIKRDLWEGGIKMPTIVRYPNVIPAKSKVVFPSGHWDWLATFADLANVAIPAYTDGVSLMPSLKQNKEHQIDKGFIYQEYNVGGKTPKYLDFEATKRGRNRNQMQVIRLGDFKGVRYDIKSHSTPFEIYNIVKDPRESINLATSMPELQQKMLDKVLQVRKVDSTASRPYDNELIPNVSVQDIVNGLEKSIYKGKYEWVPNFDYLLPISSKLVSEIELGIYELNSDFGLSFKGFIEIPQDGKYTFYLQSSGKCHIMIHDIHLLDNDFEFSNDEIKESINLKKGLHPIQVFYQQNDEIIPKLNLQLQGPNRVKSDIEDTLYFTRKKH